MNRIDVRTVVVIVAIVAAIVAAQGSKWEDEAILFACLIPSVILHEVAHGYVAYWFGDDTAKRANRLSLDPSRHVDPFYTLLLPAILLLAFGFAFGAAKPVPVNVGRLRNPRNHGLLVALAGIFVNAILVGVALLVLSTQSISNSDGLTKFQLIVYSFGYVNVVLAVFNALPIPPLDGSAVLERFLPNRWWGGYLEFRRYAMILLIALVFLGSNVIGAILDPFTDAYDEAAIEAIVR